MASCMVIRLVVGLFCTLVACVTLSRLLCCYFYVIVVFFDLAFFGLGEIPVFRFLPVPGLRRQYVGRLYVRYIL